MTSATSAHERKQDLIAALYVEQRQIEQIQSILRIADIDLTLQEIEDEIRLSAARSNSLGATHAQVMIAGIER